MISHARLLNAGANGDQSIKSRVDGKKRFHILFFECFRQQPDNDGKVLPFVVCGQNNRILFCSFEDK